MATKYLPRQAEDRWACLAETPKHICARNAGHPGRHMDAEWPQDGLGPIPNSRGTVIAEWSGKVCRTCGGQRELQPEYHWQEITACPTCQPQTD